MVRPPTFDSNGIKKGAWNAEEDNKLRDYVLRFGHSNWQMVPILAGLPRCGKSCRLRWLNYLKPGLKRGKFTKQEEDLIIKLHAQIGSKWSIMATHLPGRTDNEIKNYWHAHINKRRPNKITRESNKINIAPDEDHIPVENPDLEISIAAAAAADDDDPYFPSLIRRHEEHLYYGQCYSSSGSNYQYQPLEEEDDAIFYVELW